MLIHSTAAETMDQIIVPHSWTGPSTGYGKLWADVYATSDVGAGETPVTYTFTPNEDLAVNNMFYTAAGVPAWSAGPYNTGAQNLDQYIDDTADESTDYVMGGETSYLRLAFNSAGLAAGRVLAVSFQVRAFSYNGYAGQGLYLDLYNNTTFVARLGAVTPPVDSDDTTKTFRNFTLGPFYVNPLTEEPWTRTDIINMDTGTNLMAQLTWRSNTTAVAAVRMFVDMISEKRVAVAVSAKQTSLPSGRQTNIPLLFKTVTGTDNWSKANATDYLCVVRRLDDPTGATTTLIPSIYYIDDVACPHGEGKAYADIVLTDASGRITSTGSVGTRTYGMILGRSDSALSVDSQVYHDLYLKPCHTSSTLLQGINGAAATTYKGVRLLVGYVSGSTPSTDLTIKVKRTSDNVQMGGNGTVSTAVLASSGTSLGSFVDGSSGVTVLLYAVTINLASSASLAAATNYYFELSSATASTAPWYLMMFDSTATHALTGNQTYGGTTDQATVAGSAIAAGDFYITLATSLTTPSSISAALNNLALPDGSNYQFARVTWVNGGALGGLFSRWELERSVDGGTNYTQIAWITTEATLTFDDYLGPRGVAAKYRLRARRTDGALSDYVTLSGTVTPAVNSGLVIFATNTPTATTTGYVLAGTDTNYEFPGASEVTFMRLHNRDLQAAFQPLENRGLRWKFRLIIHQTSATPAGGSGAQAFSTIINVSRTTGAVCMITMDGERKFGALQVTDGDRGEWPRLYIANCVFTETSTTESVVTI